MMYQLVFKGECASGVDEATARQRAKALFKASDAQVEKMFSSARVVIRNKLDGQTAQKYQGVLGQKGMICHIEPMPGQEEDTSSSVAQQSQGSAGIAQGAEKKGGEGGDVAVVPGDRPPMAGEKVDAVLAGTSLSVAALGDELGEVREEEPPVFDNIDNWTVAPPGEQLVESKAEVVPEMPDTSHLSLADDQDTDKTGN